MLHEISHRKKNQILTDAFPAVTTPSFLNTGFNLAKASIVALGLNKRI